ncbi:MAG: hypothetical protein AAF195_04670 [Pseudomonadota bacterium]
MIRFFFTACLLLLLTNCNNGPKLNSGFGALGTPFPPVKGPPEYVKGWQDGCETGKLSTGNGVYKALHNVKFDPNLMRYRNYSKAWIIGQKYCGYYSKSYLEMGMLDYGSDSGLFGYLFGGEYNTRNRIYDKENLYIGKDDMGFFDIYKSIPLR